jgi:hypothetical protein
LNVKQKADSYPVLPCTAVQTLIVHPWTAFMLLRLDWIWSLPTSVCSLRDDDGSTEAIANTEGEWTWSNWSWLVFLMSSSLLKIFLSSYVVEEALFNKQSNG